MKRISCLVFVVAVVAACSRREAAVQNIDATNAPVIIISVDTLRSDRLPAYGYQSIQTPHIDSLRADSILFSHAYSHVPLTLPAHASILTGLLPPQHGVRNNIGFRLDGEKHPGLPSLLKARGYATGAAVSAYVLRAGTGMSHSFDFYDDRIAIREGDAAGRVQRKGSETAAIAEKWIAERGQQPFFFLLHLFEPHSPYEPTYDADIVAADAVVGRFIESLKRSGVYDRAIIIFLSDHGEGLGDHGEDEHGIFVYREAIQVPLMLKLPSGDRRNSTVKAPVQLIDILPTVASLTGLKVPAGAAGQSLLAVADQAPRRIYAESLYARFHLGWSELRSLVDDRFHFIEAPRPELYAVTDSAERTDVIEENRRVYAAMRDELATFPRDVPQIGNIDPEEAKKLAALGYLSSTSSATGPLPDPKDRIGDITLMKEAGRLEDTGRRDQAVATYRRILEQNPRFTDAWTMLGRTLGRGGRFQEAADTYKRGIQIAPSLAGEFGLSLGNVYLLMNKPAEAAEHARLGLATNPGSAHVLIGRAALAQDDLGTAAREVDAAMKMFGYRAAALVLRAQILVKEGKLGDALKAVDEAAKVGEAPALLHYVRGDVLARLNRFDEAVIEFNEEIRLFPGNRQAYASLAVVQLLTRRPRDAHGTMERLVAANPDRAAFELAVTTFRELGDEESAAMWTKRVR